MQDERGFLAVFKLTKNTFKVHFYKKMHKNQTFQKSGLSHFIILRYLLSTTNDAKS